MPLVRLDRLLLRGEPSVGTLERVLVGWGQQGRGWLGLAHRSGGGWSHRGGNSRRAGLAGASSRESRGARMRSRLACAPRHGPHVPKERHVRRFGITHSAHLSASDPATPGSGRRAFGLPLCFPAARLDSSMDPTARFVYGREVHEPSRLILSPALAPKQSGSGFDSTRYKQAASPRCCPPRASLPRSGNPHPLTITVHVRASTVLARSSASR